MASSLRQVPHLFAHTNLKAANILLDHEFMPRLCDSALAVLRPFGICLVAYSIFLLARLFNCCDVEIRGVVLQLLAQFIIRQDLVLMVCGRVYEP
ncbi:hypothetical protein C5167_038888 [Papaver somniferum]|uniref:Protein kinase domain-containing protein n=1 Tax=Papaver somniferum TaxID=3469 RepID=A0A4Y7IDY2_PAPSO|nr:hypothetical protein C5167_038888 [Papaver somniferum]